MARELVYRLSNPGYTIYHRAALGGLAATVRAWGAAQPPGIAAAFDAHQVRITWAEELSDQEALKRILAASFRLTDDKLISIVGHAIPSGSGALGLRLAVHNGVCATFLQHHTTRPSEKAPRKIVLKDVDDDVSSCFSYKAVNSYAHQDARGTGLLDVSKANPGRMPRSAAIPQSIVPGALTGVAQLEAPADEVILLLYLVVGSAIFLLRSRVREQRTQACIVVPDVSDLVKFSRAMQTIMGGTQVKRFSNTYLGRVVGGAEEAALRLIIDLTAEDMLEKPGIRGCQVVGMGRVPWDRKQTNRSTSSTIGLDYPERRVFLEALTYLGNTRVIQNKNGESFAVPTSPIPELVAANLASGRHWAAHFKALVSNKRDFSRMRFAQRGLHHMKEAIQDRDDQVVVGAFQDAWHRRMGEMKERETRDGASFFRAVEVEQERIRNAILRARTADALASWFLRFCADATKGAPLVSAQKEANRLRRFLFGPRNAERLQNLLLFALLSYTSGGLKHEAIGEPTP